MNEKRKGPLRRQPADRRTRGERRMELQRGFDREAWREDRRRGLERLFDREGRSDEDIHRDATEWWDELDRRFRADRRSGAERRQQPDRRST